MYQVFWGSEADKYPDELVGIFRLRHRVFRERLNWAVESEGGLEHDAFDDLNPVYFVSINKQGEVDGTWRLLPTTGPYMLRDVFGVLLDGRQPPNSPVVWEMSRLALDRSGGKERCTIAVLFAAAMEFCWARGIRELVVVHDARMAKITKRSLGYRPSWETASIDIDGTSTSAAQYRIDSPAAFRKRVGLAQAILDVDAAVSAESVA